MSARFDLAVLGHPVSHSLSPVMHEAGLDALGLVGSYVAIDVDEAGMGFHADLIRRGVLSGANITMPHKRIAAELCDVMTDVAARAGAVNTWYREDGGLFGHTTDVHGVREVISRRSLPTASILILGSGGAAAAALVACDGLSVKVSARSQEKAVRLVADTGIEAEVVAWGEAVQGALILNATPIGMRGESLPPGLVGAATGFFDMTYGSGPSPALLRARAHHLPTADGIDLLAAQAEESFRIWTGLLPPQGLFEQVARNASRTPDAPPIQEGSE
jgi:shikimate dehydrogenase